MTNTNFPKIHLIMIVKDEEHNLKTCIEHALPLVDSISISDTGSLNTDYLDKIKAWLDINNVPCLIYRDSWVDFSHNRNKAISNYKTSTLYQPTDYLLFLDADDRVVGENGNLLNVETANNFKLKLHNVQNAEVAEVHFVYGASGLSYYRPAIIRADTEFKYQGAIHECITIPQWTPKLIVSDSEFFIRPGHSGSRSKTLSTYLKDAQILSDEMNRLPHRASRNYFYMGQSYRCYADIINNLEDGDPLFDTLDNSYKCGDFYKSPYKVYRQAILCFELCIEKSNWVQEQYIAYLNIGRIKERIMTVQTASMHDIGEIATAYTAALKLLPRRKEAYFSLSQLYLNSGLPLLASKVIECCFDTKAVNTTYGSADLFAESWIYEWGDIALAIAAEKSLNNDLKVIELAELFFNKFKDKTKESIPPYAETVSQMVSESINILRQQSNSTEKTTNEC